MADDRSFKVKMADDKSSVTLTISNTGVEPVVMNLDASELERVIQNLFIARTRLTTPLPNSPGTTVEMIKSDRWKFAMLTSLSGDTRAFSIRHPGCGWLTFEITQEGAREVAQSLTAFDDQGKATGNA